MTNKKSVLEWLNEKLEKAHGEYMDAEELDKFDLMDIADVKANNIESSINFISEEL